MQIKKIHVAQMLKMLEDLEKDGFEFFDMDCYANSNQGGFEIFTKKQYLKPITKISDVYISEKLNDNIINALLN